MIEHLKMVFFIVIEAIKDGKVMDIFHDQIWFRRELVPVELNLAEFIPNEHPDQILGCQFVELKEKELKNGEYSFVIPNRKLKALRNLKRGWRGFALVQDSEVVGDIWAIITSDELSAVLHSDLDMLGITCGANEAYAFDMLIAPSFRGKNIAVLFQRALQFALKMENCKKMYGFYWEDNIPAMWMHKMLGFKELPKRRISRFFFIKWFE